jgi:hypothetical protein
LVKKVIEIIMYKLLYKPCKSVALKFEIMILNHIVFRDNELDLDQFIHQVLSLVEIQHKNFDCLIPYLLVLRFLEDEIQKELVNGKLSICHVLLSFAFCCKSNLFFFYVLLSLFKNIDSIFFNILRLFINKLNICQLKKVGFGVI